MVLVADLNIDPAAQRALSKAWVKAHIPKFDVDQLGYIVINRRLDSKLYTVDGQHRVELMRAVGWGDQKIHAECFDGLTQAEEAALFNARNDKKSVTTFDKFRVAITSGDPTATDIARIVNETGLTIAHSSGNNSSGHIFAVDALLRVYSGAGIVSAREGPAALAKTLRTLVRAWGQSSSSLPGKVIHGLGLVFLRYGGKLSELDMVTKLKPVSGGAPGLMGRAKSLQETCGRPVHHCVASIIVDTFNKGRRTSKLERWDH